MGTKERSGGKEIMEEDALTGAEAAMIAIWCFGKGLDWLLIPCS